VRNTIFRPCDRLSELDRSPGCFGSLEQLSNTAAPAIPAKPALRNSLLDVHGIFPIITRLIQIRY
jgi:hypothetical protein